MLIYDGAKYTEAVHVLPIEKTVTIIGKRARLYCALSDCVLNKNGDY